MLYLSGLFRPSRLVAAALLFAGSMVAIAQVPGAKTATTPPSTSTPSAAASVEQPVIPPGVPSSDTQSQYVIGPGDTIQVFVWRNPELTVTVPVRPDGKVSSPLVEDMTAAGKTPTQLARDIEARLGEYIRTPQVSIIVSGAVSTFSQIRVIGQVRSPQALPYREGMTVLDVALVVGGLTEFAAGNKTKIVRKNAAGKDVAIKVRLEDLMVKGKLAENRPLQPGDVIIVPESLF
jgi:polysaccharide export outer membrane protein